MKALLAMAVAVATLPGLTAALSVPTEDPVVALFVGEDLNGNIVTREIRGSQAEHNAACGGIAPVTSDCSTGQHLLGFFTLHGLLIPRCGSSAGAPALPAAAAGGCMVGDFQSVLTGNTERRFNCSIIRAPGRAGTLVNEIACAGQGTFPTGTVTHDCHARAYSSNDNSENGGGVPGAVGDWGCLIIHF